MIGELVTFAPVAGDVIVTTGAVPRLTVIAWLSEPNALVQATVIAFAPVASATELVVGVVDDAPFTVQVVPAGIVVEPLTV